MKPLYFIIIFCNVLLLGYSQTIQLQAFGTGFTNPVEIAHSGSDKLFVVEQAGIIKILNADGSVNPTPFLNISSVVGSGGERGLLGLAFSPDYASTGRFYVCYTDNSSTSQPNTIVARYSVSANPDIANTNGTILLNISQPFSNHNGGKIAFGGDGFLYISIGDGGSGGDPGDRAQDTKTLLGKLLRIDVSGTSYSIPATNPFSSSANGINDPRPEIFAIGLRNAWKFSFDKSNNDLWIADVGQNAYEEINKVADSGNPGDNYGWRCYEGDNHIYNNTGNCPSGGFSSTVRPVSEYPHVGSGCSGSVTGGFVYRGSTYSSFAGKYFFADFCTRNLGILTDIGAYQWSMSMQTPNITQGWTTFGEDLNGELYIAGGSTVYKIRDANLSVNESNTFNFKIYPNPSFGDINIDLSNRFKDVTSLSIYNIQGQKVTDITKPNQQTLSISTKNFKSGIYFLEVIVGNSSKLTKKLIIN